MKPRLLISSVAVFLLFSVLAKAETGPTDCASMPEAEKSQCLLQAIENLIVAGDLQAATPLAFEAMEAAQKSSSPHLRYKAHLQMGRLYFSKNDLTNAMRQYVQALRIANEEKQMAWTIEAKGHIGETFTTLEDYAQAEVNLQEALVLAQNEGLIDQSAAMHSQLGEVYLKQGVLGKSQEHLKQALDLFVNLGAYADAAFVSRRLAEQYLQTGDYENADTYANRSYELHMETGDMLGVASDNMLLGKIYMGFSDTEGAIEMAEAALAVYEEKNDKIGVLNALRDVALYRQDFGDKAGALAAANRIESMLEKMNGEQGWEVARDMSLFYERNGDTDKALAAQRDYARRREAFINGEKSRALLELTTRYESEFATEQQQRKIEMLELNEAASRRFRLFLLALLAMVGALAINLFQANRRKQRDNALLTEKNTQIQRQKTEIDLKNLELAEKNENLATLNGKLVDEMAEREAIQKTSFARDRFLATMSHEMRTPINIISGLCHLLLEESPRPDQVEHLRTLQFSANNLVVFINDILDFSKIEAGKLNLDRREFNPKRLFDEISTRFETPAREKEVKVSYHFDEAIPSCLVGDPARFNQIMTNLVSTSFNHSVNARVLVGLKVEELNKESVTLRFEIEDDGQVMDEKQLESMFRSFTHNPDDVFEGYNSNDLVLAITRRLVDLQNGHIEVNPRSEGGNRFTVLLTFKVGTKTDRIRRVGVQKAYEHLTGRSILLVEDNKINQLVVQKMLTRIGIDVTTADNGVAALEVLNHRSFDLVLMDIQMPKMDGYRATAEIRKHINPSVRDVPVIALTASAFLTEREKAKLFGMNDHVGKPFAPEELLDKISTCLAVFQDEQIVKVNVNQANPTRKEN